MAVDGLGAGWSAKWLGVGGQGEWDWRTVVRCEPPSEGSTVSKDDGEIDARQSGSAASGESSASRDGRRSRTSDAPAVVQPPANRVVSPIGTVRPPKTPTRNASTQPHPTPTPRRSPPKPAAISMPGPSSSNRTGAFVPSSSKLFAGSTAARSPISPLQGRHPSGPFHVTPAHLSSDPHPHPTPTLVPASALSVYQIAHRYTMPALCSLAMEHMMSTITPQSSFPLLLATHLWEDLHNLVEDYVVDRWEAVSRSEEFEQCCQEVANGE